MQIDARGMTCPKPVVLTLEALPKLGAEEFLEVLVNDEVAVGNLTRLAEEKNCELLVADKGGYTSLTLVPRTAAAPSAPAAPAPAPETVEVEVVPATGDAVVAIGSDVMGRGSEELGRILVKGLIYALAHQEVVPKTMLFFNSGARLTCEGSEEYVYAADVSGSATAADGKQSSQTDSKLVTVGGGSDKQPILVRVLAPKFSGALIVCDGADVPSVRERVINAVSAALDLPTSKICVETRR